ncbi:MAG TPA: alpha-glucosidase [Balneolaceae bacterium]|nr:alpha-glucosidase [Balneolaceae bacterium]|tara:strand:+ start:174390 stop:176339 length:1950 start_codon:yes stop_codon:yes gene_type:complete
MKLFHFRDALLSFFVAASLFLSANAQSIELSSPDGSIEVQLNIDKNLTYTAYLNSSLLIEKATIGYEINSMDLDFELISSSSDRFSEVLKPAVAVKSSKINNTYNNYIYTFKNDFSVEFRIFNNGIAHRLITEKDSEITVSDEQFDLVFPSNSETWFPLEESFFSSNERNYLHGNIDTLSPGSLASLPVLFANPDGQKVILMESALTDYAGMWAKKTTEGISAVFPRYPDKTQKLRDRGLEVITRKSFIARTDGSRTFPWRILGVAENDIDLLSNQLVYALAEETEIKTDWIKPGKVAWDWWNAWNVKGVDFESGPNTETYKYYIDFAAANGIEYVILDEGWYLLGDILQLNDKIDVKELIRYGKAKGVDIILWVVWRTLNEQFEEAMDAFAEWGAAGIKVDFMDRDDQWMVNYYHKVAKAAAERQLLVDFHGAYKPSGIRRKYPNVITREGVLGLEYNKWSQSVTPTHNVTIPFIRMVPGPIDYTPGGLTNTQPGNHRVSHFRPMVMGTRSHEIAKFVVYESPLQMMADTPTNYEDEQETTNMIAKIPTTWDETIPLAGKVGEYIAVARRKGSTWYIGIMCNENSRNLVLPTDFLEKGSWKIEYMQDGINAAKNAEDYKIIQSTVQAGEKLDVSLAPSGGWIAILTKR